MLFEAFIATKVLATVWFWRSSSGCTAEAQSKKAAGPECAAGSGCTRLQAADPLLLRAVAYAKAALLKADPAYAHIELAFDQAAAEGLLKAGGGRKDGDAGLFVTAPIPGGAFEVHFPLIARTVGGARFSNDDRVGDATLVLSVTTFHSPRGGEGAESLITGFATDILPAFEEPAPEWICDESGCA
ncbi:hypothetical protein DIPPA_02330 [Diplonema papillatum]|nr:hypothetical protein DIPPA_02330 [Diplonema papillatum]|eukprot:gene10267-15789_t